MGLGARDTGLECLTLLLRFHQVATNPNQIFHEFGSARIGVTEMLRCARQLKLEARAISATGLAS
jgi:subfamily B ATP-binding cassette protein HlyB/CyaB